VPITGDSNPNVLASIASIVIKGTATGSTANGDHYGLTAQRIDKLSIDGEKIALVKGSTDDTLLDAANGDFRLIEV
jgi:hypothetical protein